MKFELILYNYAVLLNENKHDLLVINYKQTHKHSGNLVSTLLGSHCERSWLNETASLNLQRNNLTKIFQIRGNNNNNLNNN